MIIMHKFVIYILDILDSITKVENGYFFNLTINSTSNEILFCFVCKIPDIKEISLCLASFDARGVRIRSIH